MKYRVWCQVTSSYEIEIEANDEESAIDKVYDMKPDDIVKNGIFKESEVSYVDATDTIEPKNFGVEEYVVGNLTMHVIYRNEKPSEIQFLSDDYPEIIGYVDCGNDDNIDTGVVADAVYIYTQTCKRMGITTAFESDWAIFEELVGLLDPIDTEDTISKNKIFNMAINSNQFVKKWVLDNMNLHDLINNNNVLNEIRNSFNSTIKDMFKY